MANKPFSKDPPRSERSDENDRAIRSDSKLQPDPLLQEGRPSSSRATLLAIAVAVVVGLVFYDLNSSNFKRSSPAPIQTAQPSSRVPNSQSGVTTGSAAGQAGGTAKPQSGNGASNK